ncbi:MAG TPA: type I-C CRISPR-associated protein Cas5c [Isosphaeraceae bacterium]|jgi:CRISPR-associated protein Cas5d|nr:type I-C CRISPR-associated protein Cas5c [Isosphaeraceae bacterium]
MNVDSPSYRVRIQGDWACLTRPELKTERVSYHVLTPSAARGVIEAVLWKPAIRWHVHRIAVLKPIRFSSIKRNEVNRVIPIQNARKLMRGEEIAPYYADDDRAQRNAVILRDVLYHVDVSFSMTERAGSEDNPMKFDQMFRRRLERGQYHMAPYLGCREFPAIVSPILDDDPPPIAEDLDLGLMLLDIQYGQPNQPVFFHAQMHGGVIEVPPVPARDDAQGVAS